MKLNALIITAVICLITATPVIAKTDLDETAAREAIRNALEPWKDASAGPGAIIQVSRAGQPLIVGMTGYADVEHTTAISEKTRFHVASLSKQFTAYAIVRLASEGKINLDASLTAYLSEASVYRDVTVRDLLAHTHGIRGALSLIGASGFRPEDMVTNDHALYLILRQRAMNAPPGDAFSYSNSGFILLAEIIERITGKSLAVYCREIIFQPLGMDDTLFVDSLKTIIPRRAQSYRRTSEGYGRAVLNYALTGSTGLTTTGRDLALWAAHLDRLVEDDPDFYATFHTLGVLKDGSHTHYAYGQERREYRGLETWSHGGRDAGYRAFLLRAPSERLSISVLSNAADFDIAQTTFDVLDALLGDKLTPKKTDATTPSAQQLAAYAGDYELFPGLIFSLKALKETLGFGLLGSESFSELTFVSNHEFVLNPVTDLTIVFDPNVGQAAESFDYRIGMLGVLPATRIELEPFEPASVNYKNFEGSYYSAELSAAYDLVVRDQQLFAHHPAVGHIALSPYQNDVFNSSNNYFQKLEFHRDTTGRVTGFHLSGALMVNVMFQRVR